MTRLVKWVQAFLTSITTLLLSACAGWPTSSTDVVVGKDTVTVSGTTVGTPNELVKLLSDQKIRKVKLHPEPDVGYERIGRVIYSVVRAGADVESIDAPSQSK